MLPRSQRFVKVIIGLRGVRIPVRTRRPRQDLGQLLITNVRRLSLGPHWTPVLVFVASRGKFPASVPHDLARVPFHALEVAQDVAVLEQVVGAASTGGFDDVREGRVLPDISPVGVTPEGGHVIAGYGFAIFDGAMRDFDGWHDRFCAVIVFDVVILSWILLSPMYRPGNGCSQSFIIFRSFGVLCSGNGQPIVNVSSFANTNRKGFKYGLPV